MQHKRILGALALVLSLCFISSAIINSGDEQSDISLAATPPVIGPVIEVTYHTNGGIFSDLYDGLNHLSLVSEGLYRGNIDEGNANIYGWQLPVPTRDGHIFAGWYFDEGLNNAAPAEIKLSEDLKSDYYAKWVKTPTDGTVLSDDGNRLITAPSDAVNYTIPDGVTTIAGYAFFKCNNMQSIKFPESVTTLEAHTFDGLGLITVYIPHSATYMDQVPPFFNIVRTYPAPTADNYSSSDKFEIYTADEMVDFRKSIDSTRHYDGKIVYLAGDIEMSGIHYDFPDTFNGTFDGQGHVISGFTSHMSSPLFRIVGSNGIVKNLGIFNAYVSSEGSSNAIMAEINNGTIVYCYANECSVSWGGPDSFGSGFVFENHGTIENCYSNTSCNLGYNELCNSNDGTVTNSYYLPGSRSSTGIGTAKTAEEMKDPNFATLLGRAFAVDAENVNNGYPVFAPISTEFTVSFETNGGSEVTSQIVKEGENAVRPADPTKQGYVFGGWYTNSELTAEYTFTTPVTENTTFYAKWYENVIITSVPSIDDITATVDGRTVTLALKAQNYAKILWDMGNGDVVTTYQPALTYTYDKSGDYKVTATAINDIGESEPIIQNVAISDDNNNSENETNYYWIIGIILAIIIAVVVIGVIKS